MRTNKLFLLIGVAFVLLQADLAYGQQAGVHTIRFRPGSDIIYDGYGGNLEEIAAVKGFVSHYEDLILTGSGHIRLVAPIGNDGKATDPTGINLAALRAAVVRNYLKRNFRMLTNWSFTFYFDSTRAFENRIEVSYVAGAIPAGVSPTIYYTTDKQNLSKVKQEVSKYGVLPYLVNAPVSETDLPARARLDRINALATHPADVEPKAGVPNPEKLLIAIHYRWDRDNLDSLYLSNAENLHLLDSILRSADSKYIDTLTIVAYASPEGPPEYNKRLSERRAKTIKDYITTYYKAIAPGRIVTQARGENWEGLRKFAVADSALPLRDEVLKILDSGLSDLRKQSLLTRLEGGKIYYRYILPNYYRYLRNGASVLITYRPDLPKVPVAVVTPEPKPEPERERVVTPEPEAQRAIGYPVAFKSNLLLDAVGALNIGVEVPIGKHFSVVGDFAYAYWRSSKNLYALQTLQGGVEARYWFGTSDRKKLKNPEWAKPLRGWNVGLYGLYCSRYDVQWIDGYQGDGFWSAGLTAGYATPIARNLTLEFSLAAGYLRTPEYRHYHRPEYDVNGKYHLMWQRTGSFGTFTLTQARINLVWLIGSSKKGGRK